MICDYGCGNPAAHTLKNKRNCCETHSSKCPAIRAKNSRGLSAAHSDGRMRVDQFDGKRGWSKGKTFFSDERISAASGFVEDSKLNRTTLRRTVLSEGLIQHACAVCQIGPEWNGIPLTLELDHVNGNNTDNRLTNLRFLCPNCHSQTPTFRAKNFKPVKRVTDDELLQALRATPNIRQALIAVGLMPKAGNWDRARRLMSISDIR